MRFSDKTWSSAVSAPYCTGPVYGLPGQQEEQAHLACFKAIWCLRLSEDSILYPKSIKGLLKTPRLVTLDVDGFDEIRLC